MEDYAQLGEYVSKQRAPGYPVVEHINVWKTAVLSLSRLVKK